MFTDAFRHPASSRNVVAKPSINYLTQVLYDTGVREKEVQALLDKSLVNIRSLNTISGLTQAQCPGVLGLSDATIDPLFHTKLRRATEIINQPGNKYEVRTGRSGSPTLSRSRSVSPSGRRRRDRSSSPSARDLPAGVPANSVVIPKVKTADPPPIPPPIKSTADIRRGVVPPTDPVSRGRTLDARTLTGVVDQPLKVGVLNEKVKGRSVSPVHIPAPLSGPPDIVVGSMPPPKMPVIHHHLDKTHNEFGYHLHRKHDGITTRGVWLEWEPRGTTVTTSQQIQETFPGMLWRRTHTRGLSRWVYREVVASMIPGSIEYKSKNGRVKKVWLVPGCMAQLLSGKYFGRANCLRISWPSGYDLMFSANTPKDMRNWFDYVKLMLMPPAEYIRKRNLLVAEPLTQALIKSSIRSLHYKEREIYEHSHTPRRPLNLRILEATDPPHSYTVTLILNGKATIRQLGNMAILMQSIPILQSSTLDMWLLSTKTHGRLCAEPSLIDTKKSYEGFSFLNTTTSKLPAPRYAITLHGEHRYSLSTL